MEIQMKCFADLTKKHACDYRQESPMTLDNGSDVSRAIRKLGVPDDEVKVVFVNGKASDWDRVLANGDRVTLVPHTGGM